MQNACHAVATESMEEQVAEPPGSLGLESGARVSVVSHKRGVLAKPESKWNDWRWQVRNRIRTPEQLTAYVPSLTDKDELRGVIGKYPMAITPYYASLIGNADVSDPIFSMSVPDARELIDPVFLSDDPLEEHEDMPVPGLVHRYPDRALLLATTMCSMYCRHCTRKRMAGTRENSISAGRLRQVVAYLRVHPEISDVIISGGDPLTMSDGMLDTILSALRSVPTVHVLRIGTRAPVVLPMRITAELTDMLKKHHPLWINTHFNHPCELTERARKACARLADAGIPVGNQTVLLRGVNDTPQTIERLCRDLVRCRVRPYYLYQCDLVRGIEHFRTSLRKGIEIMEYMRGRVSGIAIPTFVVDIPCGGGKTPILPGYIVSMSDTHTVIRNYEGMLVNYPEPNAAQAPAAVAQNGNPGVWGLASGLVSVIRPEGIQRPARSVKSAVRVGSCGAPGFLPDA